MPSRTTDYSDQVKVLDIHDDQTRKTIKLPTRKKYYFSLDTLSQWTMYTRYDVDIQAVTSHTIVMCTNADPTHVPRLRTQNHYQILHTANGYLRDAPIRHEKITRDNTTRDMIGRIFP